MIKILTTAQMREVDRVTIEEIGTPGVVLMENAGLAVVNAIRENVESLAGKKILIFAGKGNNGGDGFVVARHLYNLGANPVVFLAARKDEVKGDAKINLDVFVNMGGTVKELTEPKHLQNFKLKFMHATVVVDALLGTGIKSEVTGFYADIIGIINTYGNLKVSVDIPSGINADSGDAPEKCVHADITVTFGLPKVGLVTSPARNFAGNIVVADISIPANVVAESPCAAYLIEAEDIAKILPPRAWDAHKGSFGHLAMACGSKGMAGAAALAGAGALKMGSGLVTCAVPEGIGCNYTSALPEMMLYTLAQTESGSIAAEAAPRFIEFAGGKTAALLGCGLTSDESTKEFVRQVVAELDIPMVIDADGLNCIGQDVDIIKNRKAPTVVAPHPGEMARLTGKTTAQIQAGRIEAASEYSKESGAVTVLKGAGTLIATPEGEVYLNHTGNNGLATGGAGDVLAGMIAGVMAQGAHPEDASIACVYLHGLCADRYVEKRETRSLIPTDLLHMLPDALAEFHH